MQIHALGIVGAYEIIPRQHSDERGVFLENFRGDLLADAAGRTFTPIQGNRSVSRRGVVRGIHFADVPVGQAKYVSVTSGSIIDYIIDIRVGSPTFGQWLAIPLDDVERRAVFLAEGLGHLFIATSEQAAVSYLTNDVYKPNNEHAILPTDPDLALGLEDLGLPLVLSRQDLAAPTLQQAQAAGNLPTWQACLDHYASLVVRP